MGKRTEAHRQSWGAEGAFQTRNHNEKIISQVAFSLIPFLPLIHLVFSLNFLTKLPISQMFAANGLRRPPDGTAYSGTLYFFIFLFTPRSTAYSLHENRVHLSLLPIDIG